MSIFDGYLLRIVNAIEEFWYRSPDRAKTQLAQAEKHVEIIHGRETATEMDRELAPWLQEWKKIIKEYETAAQPINLQEIELVHSSAAPKMMSLQNISINESVEEIQSPNESFSKPRQAEIIRLVSEIEESIEQVSGDQESIRRISESDRSMSQLSDIENDIRQLSANEDNIRDLSANEDSMKYLSVKEELENKMNIALQLYEDDRIFEAFDILNELKNSRHFDIRDYPILQSLEEDYYEVSGFLESLKNRDGWKADSENGKIKIYYKHEPGEPTVSILTESTVDVPLEHLLAIIYETDLYVKWVPFCKKSNLLNQLSRGRKILLQEFKVTGIIHRETCLYGYGANLLHVNGSIVIYSKSCDSEETFKGVRIPPQGKTVRAKVVEMGCHIEPLGKHRCSIKIVTNFNPKLKIIPYSILNYASRKLAKGIFKKLSKLALKFEGSEYQELRNLPNHKPFYDHIQVSLDEYFNSL